MFHVITNFIINMKDKFIRISHTEFFHFSLIKFLISFQYLLNTVLHSKLKLI